MQLDAATTTDQIGSLFFAKKKSKNTFENPQ